MLHRGRLPAPKLEILGIRELTRDDLACLRDKRTTSIISRFRDPHHRVARLAATGLRPAELAEKCGFSLARIYVFLSDPAFQDLVSSYRRKVDEGFVESQDEYYTLATSNMVKAERQLAEKLDKADEEGELLPVRDLLAISRDAADRFGYGKKTTNLNINVDFAKRLEQARQRSGRQTSATDRSVIEGNLVRKV